jgi:hypothetical protein
MVLEINGNHLTKNFSDTYFSLLNVVGYMYATLSAIDSNSLPSSSRSTIIEIRHLLALIVHSKHNILPEVLNNILPRAGKSSIQEFALNKLRGATESNKALDNFFGPGMLDKLLDSDAPAQSFLESPILLE